MRIITGGSTGWESMVLGLSQKASELGYPVTAFNLGGMIFGVPFEVDNSELAEFVDRIPRTTHKARLVLRALEEDEEICLMDADAFPIRPLDLSGYDEFDVAVTIRTPSEIGGSKHPKITGYCNSGVMFFRRSQPCEKWLQQWDEMMKKLGNDQWAINELTGFRLGWMDDDWKVAYNRVYEIDGVKVLLLPTWEWNYYYFNREPGEKVKVLHFKGSYRKLYPRYFRNNWT